MVVYYLVLGLIAFGTVGGYALFQNATLYKKEKPQ